MTELFRAVSARLKALLTAHAALELEAELVRLHTERKAALLRQAAQLEAEGMADLAAEIRRHASQADLDRPCEAPVPGLASKPPAASPLVAGAQPDGGAKRKRSQAS
jgi:hypothetical protein